MQNYRCKGYVGIKIKPGSLEIAKDVETRPLEELDARGAKGFQRKDIQEWYDGNVGCTSNTNPTTAP